MIKRALIGDERARAGRGGSRTADGHARSLPTHSSRVWRLGGRGLGETGRNFCWVPAPFRWGWGWNSKRCREALPDGAAQRLRGKAGWQG